MQIHTTKRRSSNISCVLKSFNMKKGLNRVTIQPGSSVMGVICSCTKLAHLVINVGGFGCLLNAYVESQSNISTASEGYFTDKIEAEVFCSEPMQLGFEFLHDLDFLAKWEVGKVQETERIRLPLMIADLETKEGQNELAKRLKE